MINYNENENDKRLTNSELDIDKNIIIIKVSR